MRIDNNYTNTYFYHYDIGGQISCKGIRKTVSNTGSRAKKVLAKDVVSQGLEITKTIKEKVNKILKIFEKTPEELPDYIKPVVGSKNNIIGISLQTEDNSTLKVSKKFNSGYGKDLIYLSFEKLFPDGAKSYMSIDLLTYNFLRMKEAGKPLIRNNAVYEYSIEEISKRNMVEKLSGYLREIVRDVKPATDKEVQNIKKDVKESSPEVIVPTIPKTKNKIEGFSETDIVQQAKKDASALSDIYFKAFKESFESNISKKMSEFKSELAKLFS